MMNTNTINASQLLPAPMQHVIIVSPDNYILGGVRSLNNISDHSFSLINSIDDIKKSVAKCPPTLIFIDYDLLGIRPIEFLTTFKANFPNIKVVLIKSNLGSDIELECMKNGVNFFILKPPFSVRILAAVETVLAS